MISATNNTITNDSSICLTMRTEANKSVKNISQFKGTPHYVFNPRVIIGMELSFVPEVDSVFVACEQSGKAFRVITIVNEIDDAIETKIYEREEAIMDTIQSADFDFRILARHNRALSEVITDGGQVVFTRERKV
jgi:hypothetical protein